VEDGALREIRWIYKGGTLKKLIKKSRSYLFKICHLIEIVRFDEFLEICRVL